MAIVKVNRSGKNHKICLTNTMNPNEQIGTLYNNEVFTWIEPWNGNGWGYAVQAIAFRGSDGTVKKGWISGEETDKVFENNICSLAKFTKVIKGKTYYGFKMRRDEELYDRNGKSISKIAFKDLHVLCESSTAGSTHNEWLSVVYLESGKGTDIYNEIISGSNAFIDIGYDKGSMFNSNASLIGSL
ncbi:MAG: hypothetical protein K6G30_10145 [Acetatifactor sp.]|nr:hypothetical protein [Acetatifactor sp.]